VGLLLELQHRIPDRWFLRRLLPAAIFVAAAFVAAVAGQSRWSDFGLARARLSGYLGHTTSSATATVLIYLLLIAAAAFTVPVIGAGIGTAAAGGWPWWLAPLGDRIRAARAGRWASRDTLTRKAVLALADGRRWRAARLKARAASATTSEPATATWIGDRLAGAADEIRECLGVDVYSSWAELLLRLPEEARTALTDARDGYDAACDASGWSLAYLILGVWWWPAAVVGLVLALISWRWLRNGARVLASTAVAAARVAADPSRPRRSP
jgi:hypothetical protein